jgi:glycosyltransferase involved in cell wall biosynthesis
VNDPSLLIAIPTYNRAPILEIAVRSLMQQVNVGQRWSVLIVDNNSADDTVERLARLRQHWPRLAYVTEYTRGSSAARNRALAECAADYVLFTDDECTYPIDFVDRALAIVDTYRPVLFGGSVLPWYQQQPPAWFKAQYGSYSLPQSSGRAGRISFSGANIGFNVNAVRAIGGFDNAYGIHGAARGYGEETELELRILAQANGNRVWYDPDFHCFHLVLPNKYQWGPLLKEHFQRGIARARVARSVRKSRHGAPINVPDCLRPQPAPKTDHVPFRWQHLAYEKGLALVRQTGIVTGHLLRL